MVLFYYASPLTSQTYTRYMLVGDIQYTVFYTILVGY